MKKNKRKKISILNILFLVLILSLITSLVFKNRENFKNIFTKKNKIKAQQVSEAADLQIGDIVYYNHKYAPNKAHETNQTATIPVGDSATPGSGYGTAAQAFSAKNYNTTWRVWDKIADSNKPGQYKIMLVSNKTVPYEDATKNLKRFTTYGAVGHIWWEHNAHKISSIFGYGEGADTTSTQGFPYKVGSGIDYAPDMMEGDRGNWKIGIEPKDRIKVSGARSLTVPEMEGKLEITPYKINIGYGGIKTDSSIGYRKVSTNTRMEYVVQRDIGSASQVWAGGNKLKGKAWNRGYTMTNGFYYWEENNITADRLPNRPDKPGIKYRDMLFNGIDTWSCLATNALGVDISNNGVLFARANVGPELLSTAFFYLVGSYENYDWRERDLDPSLRVVVFLRPNIKYLKSIQENNAWDIYPNLEDKNVKLSVSNLSSEPANNINLKINKMDVSALSPEDAVVKTVAKKEVNGKIEYTVKAKKFDGQKRVKNTTGDNAKFSKIDNKYNVAITGIPAGYDFKIIGKTGKQIDLDTDTNLEYELVIYPKPGTQNILVEYVGGQNDNSFAVTGNLVIKYGAKELARKNNVTLKRGVNSIPVYNVDLFDSNTNTLRNYTIEFTKSYTDNSSHTVRCDSTNKKLIVNYVPKNKNINISVSEDSKKYLSKITEIKLRLVGGTTRNISLKPTGFSTNETVPERDTTGKLINYSLQKVENIPGYYLSIDGFKVNLKPILKLPFTGTELSKKNIAIISFGMFGVALIFRFRKRIVFIFKEYTIMK